MDPTCIHPTSFTIAQYKHLPWHSFATFPSMMPPSKCVLLASARSTNGSLKTNNRMRKISERCRNETSVGQEGSSTAFRLQSRKDVEKPSSLNGAVRLNGTPEINLQSTQTVDTVRRANGIDLHTSKSSPAPTFIKDPCWEESQDSGEKTMENGAVHKEAKNERRLNFFSDEDLFQVIQTSETKDTPEVAGENGHNGLGIVEFLKGKNILITGATGFLAKVLVEKILRVQPGVGQLYLLIKAQNVEIAKTRLKNEVINVELFQLLRRRYGSSYETFMMRKLTPVVGDITQENLGLESSMIKELGDRLHILINSAANTTFDERYDVALNTNTKGAQRVLELGKQCPRLQLFLHVSTAFVNGQRKGRVIERPFQMGQSIAREMFGKHAVPDVNVEAELKLIERTLDETWPIYNRIATSFLQDMDAFLMQIGRSRKEVIQLLKNMGLQRAKLFGWQDTYVFSKAMGEMVINKLRGQTPVVIVRPSVIESSFIEPFAGWMEGNRMMDPIVIAYGKGQLSGFVADPNGVLDVVPVDMVANVTLAAIAKHACKPGLEVYQVASSVVNPLILEELANILYKHFLSLPYVDKLGKAMKPEQMVFFENREGLMSSICEAYQLNKSNPCERGGKLGKRESLMILKSIEQANYLADIYKPYTFYAGRFDNSNTEKLYSELSPQERNMFRFNVREIDWNNYINHIHIPGLRKYVMKERGTNMNH